MTTVASSGLRRAGRALRVIPAIRAWRERVYEDMFVREESYGYFRGVYKSFNEARRSAPSEKAIGCDVPAYARLFDDRHERIFSYDYPVLFWLSSILAPDLRVFDVGGHVGVQFYGYGKYLKPPPGLVWRVCDVPAVVAQGRKLADQRGVADRLSFTTRLSDADGFDVVIAAGSLQFVEGPSLADTLTSLREPPRHLFLNKLPLYDGSPFVTLQNAGVSFVPQHVFNRTRFVGALTAMGYDVVDEWEDRVHSCNIPFFPDRSVPHYSGLYLRRAA